MIPPTISVSMADAAGTREFDDCDWSKMAVCSIQSLIGKILDALFPPKYGFCRHSYSRNGCRFFHDDKKCHIFDDEWEESPGTCTGRRS